jgi:TMEM175 potassium channel family protein
VISFADAIFAFSITIVLLSIEVPQLPANVTESEFMNELSKLAPSFETYVISFAIIGVYWISYHRIFNRISGSHPLIVALNLVFLFFVTLISLFTILNINYGSLHIAFILFEIILVLAGSTLTIIWILAIKTKSIDRDLSASLKKLIFFQSIVPPIVFLISILISFINMDVAQYFWLSIIPCRIIINKKAHDRKNE